MKKTNQLLVLFLLALTMLSPVRAASWRDAILKDAPLIHNDSIEKSSDYLFENAIHYLHQGDMQKAYLTLHTCLQLDSTQAEVWYRLAPIYQRLQNKDSVQICLEKAHSYDAENKAYLLSLASFYSRDEKLPQAARLMETLVSLYPQEYEYYYAIAALYGEAKMSQEAIRVLKQLEEIVGKNQDISLDIYNHYRLLGKEKKGIKEMQDLWRSDPENQVYLLLLAYAYEDYKPEKAIKLYRQAIAQDDAESNASFLLANFLRRIERKDEAESLYQEIFQNEQSRFQHKTEILTDYYLKEYAQDSALIDKLFNQLLQQHPNEAQAHSLYASWLQEQPEQQLKAAVHYRQALECNPYDLHTWNLYTNLVIQWQNYDMIKSVCQEAHSYFPQEFIFPYYIAVTYSIERNYDEALKAYRVCLESNFTQQQTPQISRILGEMGDLYHMMNKMDSCYLCYEEALAFNANNAMVLNNYAYFLSVENRELEKAEKMARQAIRLETTNATYLDTYAWVCFKQGLYNIAKVHIERALLHEANPSGEVLEHYGDILWFCNQQEKAVEQWKKAAEASVEVTEKLQEKINQAAYVE